jgi:hypothetical protein
MKGLPEGDVFTGQEQVVQGLIQFNHDGLGLSKERLQVLMHLDDQGREMQYALCRQYLRNPRMSKAIESRLWASIHAFYWEITRGYHAFIADFVGNPGGSKIQAQIPHITARAIRSFGDIILWRAIRHERASEKIWLKLHNLYRIAEYEGFHEKGFVLYAGDGRESSCAQEYLRPLLLSTIPTDSLPTRHIEMAGAWLATWAVHFKLEPKWANESHVFMVDPAKGHGLRRTISEGVETCRYLATGQALDHLRKVMVAIRNGANPVSQGLGEDFRMPADTPLLQAIIEEWDATTDHERRRSARVHASREEWTVIPGVENIALSLEHDVDSEEQSVDLSTGLTHQEIMDIKLYGFVTTRTMASRREEQKSKPPTPHPPTYSDNFNTYNWICLDQSDGGLGMLSEASECQYALLGHLIGLRRRPGDPIQIGIIQRTSCRPDGKTIVGVEILCRDARLARLSPVEAQGLTLTMEDEATEPAQVAILLEHDQRSCNLALSPSRYKHERRYRLYGADGPAHPSRTIRMARVVDRGTGWLLAGCDYTNTR